MKRLKYILLLPLQLNLFVSNLEYQSIVKEFQMKYGHVDKKTGISLERDIYAEHFAEPGDLKTHYTVRFYGLTILEQNDPQKLADQLMKVNERLYMIAQFLRSKGTPRPTAEEPTGDK